jgi:hypothetical protein
MRYELFLRGSTPLTEATLADCRQRATAADLSLDPYRNAEGELRGVDLGSDPDAPRAARLCTLAFDLAREHELTVFDPQLGRAVTAGDEELIAQRLAQSAAFSLAAPVAPAVEGDGRLSPTLRLWLLVLGLMALAFLLIKAMTCLAR